MNNTQKIALNTTVQLFGKAVTVATSVLVIAYITRYLGVAGYGDYAIIFAYLGIFGAILDLGLFVIAVREIAQAPQDERAILGNMLGLKLTLSVVILGAAWALALALPYSLVVRQGILVGAISQLFMSLNQVPLGSFQARLTMYKATLSDVVGRLLLLSLVWWVIRQSGSLLDMIWAVVWTNVAVFGLNVVMMGTRAWLFPLFNMAKWRELFIAALPMGVVMVLGVIYFKIDTLILGHLQGSYAVGIYSAPYKILEVLLAVPSIFMSSVLPVMTKALRDSRERAQQVFQDSFNFLSLAALPLIAGTVVVATPVMVLISGSDFVLSGPVLQILVFSLAGSFLNSVMIYTIIAAKEQRRLIWPYVWAVIFNVTANFLLIPYYSFWGAAVITVLTELGVLIFSAYIAKKYLKLSANWVVFGKTLAISVVMGVLLWLFRAWPVTWLVIFGAIIYVALVLATKTVTRQEIINLIPQFSRK
jgi:O-antigen/teichoic acid export membrane protein